MKLKILHITQFLGVGGLEKVLELLINEQLKSGHEVELLVYDYEQSWVSAFRQNGIKIDNNFKKSKGYDLSLLRYLSKKISDVDIVHTHDINPALYISPLKIIYKFADKNFPRFIHTAHGMDHVKQRPITKLYETFVSRLADQTVGVGKGVCDVYRSLGMNEEKLRLIENGTKISSSIIDKESFREKLNDQLGISSDEPLWGAVARIVPLKNQKLIIELARLMPKVNFILIGPSGDDHYYQELLESKPSNVFMLGPRGDIPELLSVLDVFVSASTHEGIPLSVLEAGASALPCLLSDIPGHRTLQDTAAQEVAYFFTSNDLQDFHSKAIKLMDPSVKAIGTNLYQHVNKHYSAQAMYQKYLKSYLGSYAQ